MPIALLIIVITAIALASSRVGWSFWLERFAHFQLQYWGGVALLTLLLLISGDLEAARLGLVCLALLAPPIFTWYLPPVNQPTKPLVKILFANVWTGNRQYAEVLDLVRSEDPDLAIFVEVDARWRQQLDRLTDILPHCRFNHRGEIIYSRIDLTGTEMVAPDLDFGHTLMVRHLQHQGQTFTVVATHPPSPRYEIKFAKRNQHFQSLGAALDRLPDQLIVVGDFNTTPWSPYYRQFQRTARLVDAQQGWGVLPTWMPWLGRRLPTWSWPGLSLPIDRLLTRSDTAQLRATSFRTAADIGSDHLPIVVEIGIVDR
jgi:endonuclease/exonuclease/phosphatase (EEP) superfamily protein YafD